jgi:predicted AAA+ superfamily ATPase
MESLINRTIEPYLRKAFKHYPVVTVTGPRQSGKTTLVRKVFPNLPYANLEHPPTREFAQSDPESFLDQFPESAILDEIQRVPELTSYIQVRVDAQQRNSRYILTGSHQYSLREAINQSLAGRTAILRLLPLSLEELGTQDHPSTDTLLWRGAYPRVHTQSIPPAQAYADYFETYIERDLRQILNIKDLTLFERFVRLCAGRVGQLLNLNSLASDVGVSQPTAREWVSVLESSFVIFRLQPWHSNVAKRYIKTPKLYFCDTGLAIWLSGITEAQQLQNHPLRGNFYENLVISEVLKHNYNTGNSRPLHFFRDQTGNEIDLLIQHGSRHLPVEIKSGQTLSPAWLDRLRWFRKTFAEQASDSAALVHPREAIQIRKNITILNHWELKQLNSADSSQ